MSLLQSGNSRNLGLNRYAVYLGLLSISLQVVLARQAVSFAGGNEVYLSLFFMLWLVFTGLGALIIKKANPIKLFIFTGVLSLTLPALFYLAPRILTFAPGQLVSPKYYLVILIAVLLPICFFSGGLFASIAFHLKDVSRSSRIYFSEAVGALLGGIGTTLFYSLGGRDYSLLLGLAVFSIFFIPLKNRMVKIAFLLLFHAIFVFNLGDTIESYLLSYHYKPYEFHDATSGRLVRYDIVQADDITSLYSGGVKAADFPPERSSEELFYWAYLINPKLENIAFIETETQGLSSIIPDNIKADFIYPDQSWIELVDSKFCPDTNQTIKSDPISFMSNVDNRYDAIVINRGSLVSLYDKRLETEYFLKLCRDNLTADGLLLLSVPSYAGIWRDDLKTRLNGIHNTLQSSYDEVRIIPGDRLTFIAGNDINLDLDTILINYTRLNIESPYFNEGLIRSRLNQYNLTRTIAQLDESAKPTKPYEIGYGLSYYFSKLGLDINLLKNISPLTLVIMLAIALVIIFILSGFNQNQIAGNLNILYFGLASFALELIAMFKLQLQGGYLYLALGIVIGLFMAGMASGSLLGLYLIKPSTKNNYTPIRSGMPVIIIVMMALLFIFIPDIVPIILIITAITGFSGGLGYALNARIFDYKPGLPYGIDLFGGVLGSFACLGILIGSLSLPVVLGIIIIFGIILLATNVIILKY